MIVAMMARPVAGVRNHSVIVTLPGSPKGAKENLQAILKLLPHACSLADGADSRKLHASGMHKLDKTAEISESITRSCRNTRSCHHVHGESSNTGSELHRGEISQIMIPRRHRSSPYSIVPVKTALDAISEYTPPLLKDKIPVDESIVGTVLAEDVKAKESVPAFRASIVDGYAVSMFLPQFFGELWDLETVAIAYNLQELTELLACCTGGWRGIEGQISC